MIKNNCPINFPPLAKFLNQDIGDLCQESSYKCYQCREETQPTVMFNFDISDHCTKTEDFLYFSEEEIDSNWLLSSSGENEMDSPITVLDKSCVFNYHEEHEEYISNQLNPIGLFTHHSHHIFYKLD
jgi:hypothetical protein